MRVYRRFLQYDPTSREQYVDYLEHEAGQLTEAARELSKCVGESAEHRLWMRLCDMCAAHPEETSSVLQVDAVLRSGIARFSDEVGRLWCKLADYYTRLGQFENARNVYEEAVSTVRGVPLRLPVLSSPHPRPRPAQHRSSPCATSPPSTTRTRSSRSPS